MRYMPPQLLFPKRPFHLKQLLHFHSNHFYLPKNLLQAVLSLSDCPSRLIPDISRTQNSLPEIQHLLPNRIQLPAKSFLQVFFRHVFCFFSFQVIPSLYLILYSDAYNNVHILVAHSVDCFLYHSAEHSDSIFFHHPCLCSFLFIFFIL